MAIGAVTAAAFEKAIPSAGVKEGVLLDFGLNSTSSVWWEFTFQDEWQTPENVRFFGELARSMPREAGRPSVAVDEGLIWLRSSAKFDVNRGSNREMSDSA